VGLAFDLQDEVVVQPFGLQVAGAVFEVQPTLLGDGELGLGPLLVGGVALPPGQILAAEEGLLAGQLEPDVPKRQLAARGHLAGAHTAGRARADRERRAAVAPVISSRRNDPLSLPASAASGGADEREPCVSRPAPAAVLEFHLTAAEG